MIRLKVIIGALPITLLNGTTADATQVMADLNFIVSQVNANAAALANTALTNANNNFTTVQSGQAATQPANFPTALQIENNALQTLSSVLGTNTITARISAIALGAYVSGQVFTFFPSSANTGAATVNIDGLGARSILNMGSSLSGAELQTYRPSVIAFDGNANAFDLANGTPYVQGPNIPSAGTLNLDGTPGDYSQVDGTTNITAMTLSRGRQKLLEFSSSPLVSNSATLVLGSNIVPSPGDVFSFRGEAGGVVRMTGYMFAGPAYLSNALAAQVGMNNTALYFDGPSVSVSGGIWLATGKVTISCTLSSAALSAKLWDGFQVVDTTTVNAHPGPVTDFLEITLQGIVNRPAGVIKMSVRDTRTTGSTIEFNASVGGEKKDSTLSVVRIG